MKNQCRRVTIDGREFVLTNPHKLMWPESGLTKADLVFYYVNMASILSPYLAGRYLVFTRYPDGIHGKWFYQKDCPDYAPEWVHTEPYGSPSARRTLRFVTGADAATLAWLGNQACIEVHPWLSRSRAPEHPDWAVFDLDPAAPAGLAEARAVAGMLKEILDGFGLRGYLKSSGATGFHVYVPLLPRFTYAQSAGFVAYLARFLLAQAPGLITLERAVRKRGGKVYIDYLQNIMGKTIAAPYSPRPHPGAPVSAPLDWSELNDFSRPYTMTTIFPRLESAGDLFAPVLSDYQDISGVLQLAGLQTEDPGREGGRDWSNVEVKGPAVRRPAGPGHGAKPVGPGGHTPATEHTPSPGS
ncbi:MAG: non-homologous end-joining DNA ligase [Bacillota bacterium]